MRVADGGATGYAFLALRELAPTCPFAWDEPVRAPEPPDADSCLIRDGWWPTRAEGLLPTARGLQGESKWQQDLDGDGTAEELMSYGGAECAGEGQYVLFVHGTRGWRPIHLGSDELGEHHGRDVRAVPMARGALVLLVDTESFDTDPPTRNASSALRRLTPEGELAQVWSATDSGLTDEDWTFTAGPDDTITLTTPSGGRTQTLAWNAAHTTLETRR